MMTWEPRPMPYVTGETAPYWSAAAEGRLVYRECTECGLRFHYPRALCPDCFSDQVEWREGSGTGEVYTYTAMRQLAGWPEEKLPLIVTYIELTEGPRMMSNVIETTPEAIEIGDPVTVRFIETERDDVGIPVFTPAEG